MKSNLKKITSGNLVNEIISVAGVSKENAVSILNLMTNAWNVDKIGFLRTVDTGIALRKSSAKKATVKKAATKKAVSAKKATVKKSTAKKNTKAVAPVAKKSKKKLKKSITTTENTPVIEA